MKSWRFPLYCANPTMLRKKRIVYFLTTPSLVTRLSAPAQSLPVSSAAVGQGGSGQTGQGDSTQDMQQLREEIRQLKALLKEQRSRDKAMENHLTFAPEVELQKEDYAEARRRF